MPASSVESCDPIGHLLQSSLDERRPDASSSSSNFEQQLLNSAKKVLLSKVEFQPAEKDYSLALNSNLKSKYIHLNPDGGGNNTVRKASSGAEGSNGRCSVNPQLDDDGIPMPKVVIHPPNKVTLGWQRIYRIGAGLANLGNTCFLNAILQCLTYTPPLVNHLIEFDEHVTGCKNVGFCMMCELCRHIRRALEKNGETIKPQCILQKLKAIAKHMVWGRQEDAHEFLRYVMESMIKSSLQGYTPTSLDRISLETTVINHIFGGYHRSQVTCLRCKEKSDTYDHFMDIILDIKNVPSLEKALEKFVQPEILDNDNAYFCPRCKRKCSAQKKFSIHRTPNIATFQFKRFDYNRMVGGKITKQISFPEKFNMRSYMSQRNGPPVMFQLYAVLVHQGVSCNSGHYFCFVRNSNNLWYIMDDCKVRQVSLNFVLSQQAYLLFYTRVPNNPSSFSKQNAESNFLSSGATMNGTTNRITYDASALIPSKKPVNGTAQVKLKPASSVLVNSTSVKPSTSNNLLPFLNNRERVSFGMKTQPFAQLNGQANVKSNGDVDQKHPRIVMHIKHGKVTSVERPWPLLQDKRGMAMKAGNVAPNEQQQQQHACVKNLVPYIPDSSEESDQENRCKSRLSPSKASTATASDGGQLDNPPETQTSAPGAKRCSREQSPGGAAASHSICPSESTMQNHCADRTKPLAVVTSSSVKPKATSSWLIVEASQQSPSVASEGSGTSVNSTTGWTVTDNSRHSKMERQCPGWIITEASGKEPMTPSRRPPPKRVRYCNDDSELRHHSNGKCRKGPVYHSDTETHKPLRKRTVIPLSAVEDLRKARNKCQLNVPKETRGVEEGVSAKPDVSAGNVLRQTDVQPAATASSEPQPSLPAEPPSAVVPDVPKACEKPSRSDSEVVNGNHTESLSRKHRKHKKHRREKQTTDDERRSVDADSASSDTSAFRSKKRKKKHKRHHDSAERHWDGHSSDSDTDVELVWVERTKESLEQEKKDSNAAAVKYWDEDVKDGYKLSRSAPSSGPAKSACWDGRRFSTVANELVNHSLHGYGNRVSTWDGDHSQVDRELGVDFRKNRTRRYSDEYNADYDRGRTKKKKMRKQHYFDSGAGYNPFQWAQEKHGFNGRFQDRPYAKFSPKTYRHGNGSYYNNNSNNVGFNSRYEQFKYQHKL